MKNLFRVVSDKFMRILLTVKSQPGKRKGLRSSLIFLPVAKVNRFSKLLFIDFYKTLSIDWRWLIKSLKGQWNFRYKASCTQHVAWSLRRDTSPDMLYFRAILSWDLLTNG